MPNGGPLQDTVSGLGEEAELALKEEANTNRAIQMGNMALNPLMVHLAQDGGAQKAPRGS